MLDRLPEKMRPWIRIEGECWIWTKSVNKDGYGLCWNPILKDIHSHRVAYMLLVGAIPKGLTLDHLCRNRACCNPAHLEPVTVRVNNLRGVGICAINARKTHCKNGHDITDPTAISLRPCRGRFARRCKVCHAAQEQSYRKRNKTGWEHMRSVHGN